VVPGMPKEELMESAAVIAPSVQDIVNLRQKGCRQPAITIPFLEPSKKQSDEPVVIAWENQDASLQIWEALAEGRPVIYPENSAYYEQVFHAGLAYGEMEDPSLLAGQARHMASELSVLRCLPSSRNSASLFGALLRGRN